MAAEATRLERQDLGDRIGGVGTQFAEGDRHRRKRPPVMNGRTEPIQGFEMLGHAVAHVAFEAVAGMGGAEALHQPVARNLGDD